jgi:hypothetical protein
MYSFGELNKFRVVISQSPGVPKSQNKYGPSISKPDQVVIIDLVEASRYTKIIHSMGE